MASTKTKIALGIVFLPVLCLVLFEAYAWSSHDYDPRYAEIQTCIETGGQWVEDTAACLRN